MRLFIGIELDEPARTACAAAARRLRDRLTQRRVGLDVRWVPEENLHITLWFLGEVQDAEATRLSDALQSTWQTLPFPITIAGAGAFPPSGPPRILWLGVTDGAERMRQLYAELAERVEPLGFERERRPYHPHVTIARVKESNRSAARDARSALQTIDAAVSLPVGTVTLFRSRTGSGGARYEPLLRVPLKEC